MARRIQTQSHRPQDGIGAFLGLLARAAGWLVAAILLPTGAIAAAVPAIAPYVHWIPILFYALAFWSFIRAVRTLQRLAASGVAPLARALRPGAPQPERRPPARKPAAGPTVHRAPTVQRMR